MEIINVKDVIPVTWENLENYKTLRVNVEFSGADNRVIGVTSSIMGEGKSTVSLHLAYEFAYSGKKTLLIDADLRRSMLCEYLGVSKRDRKGLSELIARKCNLSDVIRDSDEKNLSLILTGRFPPNPAEMLGSQEFESIISELREQFDYIIIDTPPISSVIDASIISKSCDGMLLVLGSDMVSCRLVERVKKQLEISGCKIIGVVLNKVKVTSRALYGTYGVSKRYYQEYRKYTENK